MATNLIQVQHEVAEIERALDMLESAARGLADGLELVNGLMHDPSEPSALASTAFRRAHQQLRIAASAVGGALSCLTDRLVLRRNVLAEPS